MNDEPVAWMYYDAWNKLKLGKTMPPDPNWFPVYTHPAKTLTDEEIGDFTHRMVLCCQVHPSSADINVLGLKFIVEDILRKAQK